MNEVPHIDGEGLLFVFYLMAITGIVAAVLLISYFLGPRTQGGARDIPFESGILPVGAGRFRISPGFYLVAVFFVLFDLESVFIYAWAVAARKLGWPGYFEVAFFIGILLAALVYLWRRGGLDWGPVRRFPGGVRPVLQSTDAEGQPFPERG